MDTLLYVEIANWKFTEPATVVTDLILSLFAAYFAFRLKNRSRDWWAAAFGFISLASLLGAWWHGCQLHLGPNLYDGLWRFTLLVSATSSFCLMVAGTSRVPGKGCGIFRIIAAAKLLAVMVALAFSDSFLIALADFLGTFAALGIGAWLMSPRPGAYVKFLAASIGLSLLGGIIQGAGLAPHPWFNHNDLFHLVQIAANSLLFAAALRYPIKGL
jgi:hypothetical protein